MTPVSDRTWRPTLGSLILFGVLALALMVVESRGTSDQELKTQIAGAESVVFTKLVREQYHRDVKGVEAQRDACDASNAGIRIPLYDFITGAIDKRGKEADDPGLSSAERADAAAAAATYKTSRQAMVRAVADVAKAKGSPEVNCRLRYVLPTAPIPVVVKP